MMERLRWSLFMPGDRVLVAVSGGPDSLSLLHALWSEQEAHALATVEAAHLDHELRGNESAAEAAWVTAWCAERGIPCHVGQADVAKLARERKVGKQQAARLARYAFLEEVAAKIGATKIATGHTQDDQVETVLMNVLRGTGLDGLRGIPERRGLFVRPLLDVSRAEIEAYCAAYGLEPRRDPSNLSPDAYTRNRIRLELLPQMEQDYNPGVRQALLRLSEIAGRDSDYLDKQAKASLALATRERDAVHLVLGRPILALLHPALLRYVLRTAIADLRGTGEGVTYEHIEALCGAVTAGQAFGLTLPVPHCAVSVYHERVTLRLGKAAGLTAAAPVSLDVPGTATLAEIGWTFRARLERRRPPRPNSGEPEKDTPVGVRFIAPSSLAAPSFPATPFSLKSGSPELGRGGLSSYQAQFAAGAIQGDTLILRGWQEGDRIDPLGMGGRHKKVGDIFTDAKVPREIRQYVPIVADAQGIIWIVGHCVSERVKVTDSWARTLTLLAEKMPLP